ncbi:MAG: outer membrane lipoprotein carrier protein LolA [Prevotellaceae bacterium]|jgi:outer membrane lipoprotein-sorting protein|nr:outer membrane lipoprotein carrier protein LolA [Prevotellaceae bacterium]
MKKLLPILLVLLPLAGFSQNASALLQKFSAKMQKAKTMSITFEYAYENKAEGTQQTQAGTLLLKDNMYRLDWDGTTIFFNGEARWTYLKAVNEVSISLPNPLEDGIFANPAALFSVDEKDYNTKLRSEKTVDGKTIVEVDLFPKDEQASFTNINLRMDKSTLHPVSIAYYDKSGDNIFISVKKFDTSVAPTPTDFTFDAKKHPNVEVVDMR